MAGTMKVKNFQRAGELFIKLAMEEIEIPPKGDLAAAEKLLGKWGIEVSGYKKIKFHQDDEETLNLVVRDCDLMEKKLDAIKADYGSYFFPADIDITFGRYFTDREGFEGASTSAKAKRMQLFETFIGDYSLNQCF